MKAQKLKSGSYRVRVMIKGKSYSFTEKTEKLAMKAAKAFLAETEERIENPTFEDAMKTYIAENEKILSVSTIKGYSVMQHGLLTRYPQFCKKHVVTIKADDVQRVISDLNLSPKSARNYLAFIQAVIGKSFRVKLPQKEKTPMNIPTDLEVAGLLMLFKNTELEIPILLAAYGPLRRGEICALTLDDLDGDYVTVSKDIVRDVHGSWVTKQPKTYSSNRTLKLPSFVVKKIRQKGRITKYNADQITHMFRKKQLDIGVENPFNFHSLRHYCVSSLHANGIPDEYIMERGGWSSPNVLQNVYRHTLSDKSEEMSGKITRHFEVVSNSVSND